MSLETGAQFILTGSGFSPDVITDLVGIQPTKTWLTGDPIPRSALKMKHDGWCLATDRSDELDLAKHVKQLLDALEPCRGGILRAKREYDLDAEFACVAYIEEQAPIVHFDADLVARLSRLEAEIDVDIILIGED